MDPIAIAVTQFLFNILVWTLIARWYVAPRLAKLRPGDTLYVASNPAGFLTLSEVPDAETLWLISTGTGLAPYLSILRTDTLWQRFRNVVVVHGVRWAVAQCSTKRSTSARPSAISRCSRNTTSRVTSPTGRRSSLHSTTCMPKRPPIRRCACR